MSRVQLTAAALAGAGLALPLGVYLAKSGELMSVAVSPDGRERLELYHVARWQQLSGYADRDDAVARIADVATGDTLTTSPVLYTSGMGSVTWRRTGVDIGMAASWDRASGRWQVH